MDEEDFQRSLRHASTSDASTFAEDGKVSRRERLKGALSQAKTKIHKVREEYEVKKEHRRQEKDKVHHEYDDDVNDFLAAGRTSIASAENPFIERPTLSDDISPSTQQPPVFAPNTQQSPRRKSVPRIDVSSSLRFPNAKTVPQGPTPGQHQPNTPLQSHGYGNDFLRPAYKFRSQSSSSIAGQDRKARIRGLSVGFSDSPPVIIGEGGDEAMTPPLEISKAKARARSASPQGRKPLTSSAEPRGVVGSRGIAGGNEGIFQPKSFSRVQTGTLPNTQMLNTSREPIRNNANDDANFVPKPLIRAQTSGLDLTTRNFQHAMGFSPDSPVPNTPFGTSAVHNLERTMGTSSRNPTVEKPLTKEFEMTLGLSQKNPSPQTQLRRDEPSILAPKPQRAPPSYTLIESGPPDTSQSFGASPNPPPPAIPNMTAPAGGSQPSQLDQQLPYRKPIPPQQVQYQNQGQEQAYQYPAPIPRLRHPSAGQQEDGTMLDPASKITGPITKPKYDQSRSFADRQREGANLNPNTEPDLVPDSRGLQQMAGQQRVPSSQGAPNATTTSQPPFSYTIRRVSSFEKLPTIANTNPNFSLDSNSGMSHQLQ